MIAAGLRGWSAALLSTTAVTDVEALYLRHSRAVYRRARQLLGDAHAAEDVVQEVFVRVIRGGGGGVPAEPSATAWLYRVTTNLCLNRIRDRRRRNHLSRRKG